MIKRKIPIKVFIVVGVLIILLLILPFKIPYSVRAQCKLYPSEEWQLIKNQNGVLTVSYQNHLTLATQEVSVSQFERGDVVSFSLHPERNYKEHISKGDTIGVIKSNEWQRRLEELKGLLKTAKANLYVFQAGEIPALIEEAKKRVDFARSQAEQQDIIISRITALNDQGLISYEEFEIQKNQQALFRINVAIAESQLEAVSSGAKIEEQNLVKEQIATLEKQIAIFKDRIKSNILLAPFSGTLVKSFGGDTLLTLQNNEALTAIIPVKWPMANFIEVDQKTRISDGNITLDGIVSYKDKAVRILDGQQAIFVSVKIENNTELLAGQILHSKINCESITIREHFKRFFM
ncbi:hypothetical protein ACFL46_05270 [Candidatus Neomarinimicrobiota bacterium]